MANLGGHFHGTGATGNATTEDVVYLRYGLGADTGVNLEELVDCGAWMSSQIGRATQFRVADALLAKRAIATTTWDDGSCF